MQRGQSLTDAHWKNYFPGCVLEDLSKGQVDSRQSTYDSFYSSDLLDYL